MFEQIDADGLLIKSKEFNDPEVQLFYNQWMTEIKNYFPHYSPDEIELSEVLLLEYEGKTVGLFMYEAKGPEMHIEVDYLIPELRDIGVGRAFFNKKAIGFKQQGFKKLVALTNHPKHRNYLSNDVGFVLSPKHPDLYEMILV